MKDINSFLDACRAVVRTGMRYIATMLNTLTGGRLEPDAVTLTALIAHIPIAVLIATGHFWWGAILLAIFGLFDALDGELARLQKKAGSAGMLLDATTDRMKEVLLYCGAAYSLIATGQPYYAVWAVAACGASLSVSYVKAKGETAVSGTFFTPNEINRMFQDGLLRYEIRMTIFIIGLLFTQLDATVVIIAVFSTITAVGRLTTIMSKLQAASKK